MVSSGLMSSETLIRLRICFDDEAGVMSGLRHSVNNKNGGGEVAEALSRFSP
jgi:hypothetical protein